MSSGLPKHLTPGERTVYGIWRSMLRRCSNPKGADYRRYGGRGITVCERWQTFANFYADMGPRPAGRSIDRINNDGNYEPGNCRWATVSEQNNNTRRTVPLTFRGETHTLNEWARITGLKRHCIRGRLLAGCSVEDALTAPVGAFLRDCPGRHNEARRRAGLPGGRDWKHCEECARLRKAELPHKANYPFWKAVSR